jgi:hypothetical protein
MEHDRLFNVTVSVLTGGIEICELFVEIVEVELDFCTSRKFSFARSILILVVSFGIKLSGDSVFVDSHKVCDHVPKKMHLVGGFQWKRRTQVLESILNVLSFVSDFLCDLRQVVLNVSEHNLS